jgi:hypothetical protein
VGEIEAEGLAFAPIAYRVSHIAPAPIADLNPILRCVKLNVNHVLDWVAVDGEDFVAGAEAQRGGEGVRFDGLDYTRVGRRFEIRE